MEKNILQTLFKFRSNIFLVELADRLGFKSKKAKEFIIDCGDHHLSWQIFTIIYDTLAHELVIYTLLNVKMVALFVMLIILFNGEILQS